MAGISTRTGPGLEDAADDVVGRVRRLALYGFLTVLLACGLFEIEAWPLSGFRLFSQVRTGTQVRWELTVVDETGAETPADLAAMGRGFRQSAHLLPHLAEAPAVEQAAACAGWFEALETAERLRVHRAVYRRSSPSVDTATLEDRTLRFECVRP